MILEIAKIRTDGGTQMRAEIDLQVVETYAEAMRRQEKFPHLIVFNDGANYWMADGFHRLEALKLLGREIAVVEALSGTLREAILFAVGANAKHGLRRTNEDKRRSVETLLNDQEWSAWNDERVAECCGVGRAFVNRLRGQLISKNTSSEAPVIRETSNGKTMNVSNIGKSRSKQRPLRDEELALFRLVQGPGIFFLERENRIKAGWSQHPKQAVERVLSDLPTARLVGLAAAAGIAEKRRLHKAMECDRDAGEWFNRSADEVAQIASACGFDPVMLEPTCIPDTSAPPESPRLVESVSSSAEPCDPRELTARVSRGSKRAHRVDEQGEQDHLAWIDDVVRRVLHEPKDAVERLKVRIENAFAARGLYFGTSVT